MGRLTSGLPTTAVVWYVSDMAGTTKVVETVRERVKRLRRMSRLLHGRPGQGRKTRHVDRKKQADRLACRSRVEET